MIHILSRLAVLLSILINGVDYEVVSKLWLGSYDIVLTRPDSPLQINISRTSTDSIEPSAAQGGWMMGTESYADTVVVWTEVLSDGPQIFATINDNPFDAKSWSTFPVPLSGDSWAPEVRYDHDGWFAITYSTWDVNRQLVYFHPQTGAWSEPQTVYKVFLSLVGN